MKQGTGKYISRCPAESTCLKLGIAESYFVGSPVEVLFRIEWRLSSGPLVEVEHDCPTFQPARRTNPGCADLSSQLSSMKRRIEVWSVTDVIHVILLGVRRNHQQGKARTITAAALCMLYVHAQASAAVARTAEANDR